MPRAKLYTRPIQVWLSDDDYEKLQRLADKTDSDMSKMVRSLIKQRLSKVRSYE